MKILFPAFLLCTAVSILRAAEAPQKSSATARAPAPEKTDVFCPGMNGIAHYRIPGLVVTGKGTVLAYAEARKYTRADWGEIEVHLRRSADGGKSWGPPQQIAHHGERIGTPPYKANIKGAGQTVNNPLALVDRDTGAIEFLYCVNYARCFSMRSSDDGRTWSRPVEITAAFEPFRQKADWKVIATGPGHGIRLRTGRLAAPVWLAYGKPGEHKPTVAATLYSDDHGKTWKAGDLAVPNADGLCNPNESMLAECSDGSVMMVSRNVSRPNRKIVVFSPDGASGWSRPRFQEQLWEPVCMASVVAYPPTPGMLIYSGPRSLALDAEGRELPAGRGQRHNLSIQFSQDDGRAWSSGKTLEDGASAYSDLAVLPDGTVLCLYECDEKIVCARLTCEWISTP